MNVITLKKREPVVSNWDRIHDEINRLMNASISRWPIDEEGVAMGLWNPAVDVQESTDEILVQADLPGIAKDDISITVHEGILTIKGEKKQEEVRKDSRFVTSERRYGSFSKSILLPSDVDVTKADAECKDGVLRLRLPKREESKPKEIQIKVK